MLVSPEEVLETIRMVEMEGLDIRAVTMGINISDCSDTDLESICSKIYEKITRVADGFVDVVEEVEKRYGIPIVNKRIAVTPISTVAAPCRAQSYVPIAEAMDKAAMNTGVDLIGGFSALVHKGMTRSDEVLISSIAEALASTERVCSAVNVASTKSGINMDAIAMMGHVIKRCAELTANRDGIGCVKLAVFANAPEDNPFMPGAFHGYGEGECVINVGVSGPGVIKSVLERLPSCADLGQVAEAIKKTSFKITRMGELVGKEVSERLGAAFGIVDLSLAPTPKVGDSIAEIIELMGIEKCGAHGTTAALALLVDAVKKGGSMASSYVGGLSGTFIPVSEDSGMAEAVGAGAISIEKLEAMTSVCSVGLDMIAIPGDTPPEVISAIIADEMAIGVINNKTTSVRIIPVPGKKAGDLAEFGGLLGKTPIMAVKTLSPKSFIKRGGRIPAPIQSLRN
jgi:uncharacterized protein (UPF0210 family)